MFFLKFHDFLLLNFRIVFIFLLNLLHLRLDFSIDLLSFYCTDSDRQSDQFIQDSHNHDRNGKIRNEFRFWKHLRNCLINKAHYTTEKIADNLQCLSPRYFNGSYPPLLKGLHRSILHIDSTKALGKEYFLKASIEYSEQVGVYLHFPYPSIGDIYFL